MLGLAAMIARVAGWLSRRLNRGGGTTLPGVVLLRLRPSAIAELAGRLPLGCVLISATNGKTTTTRLVVAGAQACGLRVVTNAEGSNLERGIAAALIAGPKQADIAIFEVDEAALAALAQATRPHTVVLMNLFRDQLDRYGELDSLVDRWCSLVDDLASTDAPPTLVLNADDPNIADLGRDGSGRERPGVVWFGVDDAGHGLSERAHAADATTCRRCGGAIIHDPALLGHLGHWRCSNGDARRPDPPVAAADVAFAADGQRVVFGVGPDRLTIDSALAGLHNTYNLTAAVAALSAFADCEPDRFGPALAATRPAFGRGERLSVDGRLLNIVLAKNPTGVNQNVRTLVADDAALHVLALLNDRTADGHDVSWIWDVDWEALDGRLASLTLGGDRAWDLALRFRYAGFDLAAVTVEAEIASALDAAIEATPAGSTLHALPTYTAMLDLRAELTSRGLVDAYWSDS